MSEVQSSGQIGGASDVRHSIARAAQATGVDFNYLLAQARLESSLNPNAKAGTSSAAGLYQFLGSTWLDTLDKHGERYGLGWAGAAINDGTNGGKTVDPAMRSQIMALRYDPDAASLMAAELARDNQSALRETLGREPDFAELYMAHFLGSEGAQRFLTAMQENPAANAAALFPKQAAANRPVFFDGAGSPRSLGQVMDFFRQRIGSAIAEEGGAMPLPSAGTFQVAAAAAAPQAPAPSSWAGPLAREFHEAATGHSTAGRVSMVETLRETFAGAGNQPAALPDNVRTAYSRLKAYGL